MVCARCTHMYVEKQNNRGIDAHLWRDNCLHMLYVCMYTHLYLQTWWIFGEIVAVHSCPHACITDNKIRAHTHMYKIHINTYSTSINCPYQLSNAWVYTRSKHTSARHARAIIRTCFVHLNDVSSKCVLCAYLRWLRMQCSHIYIEQSICYSHIYTRACVCIYICIYIYI